MSEWRGKRLGIRLYGSSHGACVGVKMTGFPAGFPVDETALRRFLARRAPGRGGVSTGRQESDAPVILSGLDERSVTDGGLIRAEMENRHARPADYEAFRDIPRPGHADYTAWIKYGDKRESGGGQFSGRMTAPMCFAGGLCMQWLKAKGVTVFAHLLSVGGEEDERLDALHPAFRDFAPGEFPALNEAAGERMEKAILTAKAQGDSVGGVIECAVTGLPAGLGDALFDGMEGKMASLLFAVPGVKGVDFGAGFDSARMRGSENNDAFHMEDGRITTRTNHAGGILGGISVGTPLLFRVAMKPTPSIARPQTTLNIGNGQEETLFVTGRHDACIAVRAVPVIEAAAALILCDEMLEETKMDELERLRREISEVDAEIVPLLLKRMEIAGRIGAYKRERGLPVLDEKRGQKVLERVTVQAGAEMGDYLREIYRRIMEMSCLYQAGKRP